MPFPARSLWLPFCLRRAAHASVAAWGLLISAAAGGAEVAAATGPAPFQPGDRVWIASSAGENGAPVAPQLAEVIACDQDGRYRVRQANGEESFQAAAALRLQTPASAIDPFQVIDDGHAPPVLPIKRGAVENGNPFQLLNERPVLGEMWPSVASVDGIVSVAMPAVPQRRLRELPGKTGPLSAVTYLVQSHGATWSFGIAPHRSQEGEQRDAAAVLRAEAALAIAILGGSTRSLEPVNDHAFAGCEVRARIAPRTGPHAKPGGEIAARFYLVGGRVCTLAVVVLDGSGVSLDSLQPQTQRFFASLAAAEESAAK